MTPSDHCGSPSSRTAPPWDSTSVALDEQLAQAAARLDAAGTEARPAGFELRAEQQRVYASFAEYLRERVSHRPGRPSAFCRIILPPRTGKTVIAGHIIGRTGLATTVIVPTRTLARQTLRLFCEMLPGWPLGAWSGEEKSVVEGGVNVTTYAMLLRTGAAGVPDALRRSGLVFVDEAHRTMTEPRRRLLAEAFAPEAIRVGLTATPDYSADRRLAHFFPELIHEIALAEALDLGLLAPARAWVAEVDAASSDVRLVAGEFELETLGRIMSAAPFFQSAAAFRYSPENLGKGALLCCSTRQQAHDLWCFLGVHRPRGTPEPALLLGETPGPERELALARFEHGEIDTLVQVGVLLEGWSSPRCKLLVDLAPSVSRVRSTQKYFRAMTRAGAAEAHLFVILPTGLPALPCLPTDLFVSVEGEYECGALLGSSGGAGRPPLRPPSLARGDRRALQAVLASCPDLDPARPCGLFRFRSLLFQHPRFAGRGEALLAWLGFPPTMAGYEAFQAHAFPDAVATHWLVEHGAGEHAENRAYCEEDVAFVERAIRRRSDRAPRGAAGDAWNWLGGNREAQARDLLEAIVAREAEEDLETALSLLLPRELGAVVCRFGLAGEERLTLDALGQLDRVSKERARSFEARALRHLRRYLAPRMSIEDGLPAEPPPQDGRPNSRPWWPPRCAVKFTRTEARAAKLVLEHLAAERGPWAATEIARFLDRAPREVLPGLCLLWRQGAVRRTRDGYEAVPESQFARRLLGEAGGSNLAGDRHEP